VSRLQSGAALLLLAFCAIFLCLQVLVRPAVGIANNGDFPKMAGPFGLGPAEGTWQSHIQYGEFVYRYKRADVYVYNRGLRTADFISSEYFLVKIARGLQRILRPGQIFDIRWLGAVDATLFLLAIALWMYALPLRWRIPAGILLVLIWTDVTYVQYMNSFFMDTAALLFLVLAVAAGLQIVRGGNQRLFALIMTGAVALFTASKSQHVLPGLVFLPLFAAFAYWSRDRLARAAWIAGSLVVILAARALLQRDTPQWRSTAVFNVVFEQLTPNSPDRLQTLQDLGLGKAELRYVGTHAFYPDSPLNDPAWTRQFAARCNYGTLLRYYLTHPLVTTGMLYRDLSGMAVRMQPWGDLALEDGFKPYAKSSHFAYWTNFRSFLLKHAPWHIILLSVIVAGSALGLLLLSPADRQLAALALVVQVLAALEYAIALLADGVENERHLFVFTAATEITILLLPWLISALYTRLQARRIPRTESAVVHQ
jgi:hypothetical protein